MWHKLPEAFICTAFGGKQHSNFIFQSKQHAGVYQQFLVCCICTLVHYQKNNSLEIV